ncbi:MAG: methionyl-tRNA formyltransferase [Bdellovibrio sp.]|nr:methionyl-tRNA formyltransferase [Bdellovibrio sp.]
MKITICALGMKGFKTVEALRNHFEKLELSVVIGTDSAIQDDWSQNLVEYCILYKIPHVLSNEITTKMNSSDYTFAIGWRWLIRNIPEEKLVIFHDSLLPKYRGFAPLVNALLNKEKLVGVTALLGAKDYDRGDILAQVSHSVTYPTSIEREILRICNLYSQVAIEIISNLFIDSTRLVGSVQNDAQASYSLWRDADDYSIDWSQDSEKILHFISCVGSPYAGAKTTINGRTIRILAATLAPDVRIENRTPGKIIFLEDGFPIIVCGKGLLKILSAEELGKNLIPWKQFRTRLK